MKNKYVISVNNEEDSSKNFTETLWGRFRWGLIAIIIVGPLFPNFFPYHIIDSFWFVKGNIGDWIYSSAILLVYPVLSALLASHKNVGSVSENSPIEIFSVGFRISLFAGVSEEILFRWVIFLGNMIVLFIINYILGGFYSPEYGLIQWITGFVKIVANFTTFGLLEKEIMQPVWYAGASLIITNGLFRDGHKYQGFSGLVRSWFIGMFLFFIMFQYGLLAAIFIHFLYDLICFAIHAFIVSQTQIYYKKDDPRILKEYFHDYFKELQKKQRR